MTEQKPFLINGKTYQIADHTKHGIAKKIFPIYTQFIKDNALEIESLQLQLDTEKISAETAVMIFQKLLKAVETDYKKMEQIVCLVLRDDQNHPYPIDKVDDLPQTVFDDVFSAIFFGSSDFLKNIKIYSTSTAEAPTTDLQPSILSSKSLPETIFQKFRNLKKWISKVF